jgi:hypothetical protein
MICEKIIISYIDAILLIISLVYQVMEGIQILILLKKIKLDKTTEFQNSWHNDAIYKT